VKVVVAKMGVPDMLGAHVASTVYAPFIQFAPPATKPSLNEPVFPSTVTLSVWTRVPLGFDTSMTTLVPPPGAGETNPVTRIASEPE